MLLVWWTNAQGLVVPFIILLSSLNQDLPISVSFQLGLIIRAATSGHVPPSNFIFVTMGSTGFLLIGWRALLFSIFPNDKNEKNDVYRRGSPFELFEVCFLTNFPKGGEKGKTNWEGNWEIAFHLNLGFLNWFLNFYFPFNKWTLKIIISSWVYQLPWTSDFIPGIWRKHHRQFDSALILCCCL